ncbi:hypothetical protein AU195_20190 [Mycobacterium sp. IS-1496]|nr:hypothetical protein AU195_20190 [Mycobacterium sp. IS-1496]
MPRDVPISAEPAEVVGVIEEFGVRPADSKVPELFIRAHPGLIQGGQRIYDIVRSWPEQIEITVVRGTHFLQEDSAGEIGRAVASFVRTAARARCCRLDQATTRKCCAFASDASGSVIPAAAPVRR